MGDNIKDKGYKNRKDGGTDDSIYSDFAYDDAFRTVESECDELLIPYVNYFHNEDYDADKARIIRGRNEHFIRHPDHSEYKRITDSYFVIEEKGRRRSYHHECESGRYADSLLVRMFEYEAQIALDSNELSNGYMKLEFPYSGILVLRGKKKVDRAYIEIATPGGTVDYPVEVRYMSDITLEEIFTKRLYMLLPFYIFNLESELKEIDSDGERLDGFAEVYRDIIRRLDEDKDRGHLSSFSHGVIIALMHKVAYKIATNSKNVQRRVGDIMGGRVLDLEIIRAHREGLAEGERIGEARGEARGQEKSIKKLAKSYMENDKTLTEEKAMEMARMILD